MKSVVDPIFNTLNLGEIPPAPLLEVYEGKVLLV
jgi:hypothetical protein